MSLFPRLEEDVRCSLCHGLSGGHWCWTPRNNPSLAVVKVAWLWSNLQRGLFSLYHRLIARKTFCCQPCRFAETRPDSGTDRELEKEQWGKSADEAERSNQECNDTRHSPYYINDACGRAMRESLVFQARICSCFIITVPGNSIANVLDRDSVSLLLRLVCHGLRDG